MSRIQSKSRVVSFTDSHNQARLAAFLNTTTPLWAVIMINALAHDEKMTIGTALGLLLVTVGLLTIDGRLMKADRKIN